MTFTEQKILEHATAWNHKNRLYRNYFSASDDSDLWNSLQSLCERGLMRVIRPPSELFGGMTIFAVTEAGIEKLKASSDG